MGLYLKAGLLYQALIWEAEGGWLKKVREKRKMLYLVPAFHAVLFPRGHELPRGHIERGKNSNP